MQGQAPASQVTPICRGLQPHPAVVGEPLVQKLALPEPASRRSRGPDLLALLGGEQVEVEAVAGLGVHALHEVEEVAGVLGAEAAVVLALDQDAAGLGLSVLAEERRHDL